MNVYIVTELHRGIESNRAVCSTREAADLICDTLSTDDNEMDIEKRELDRMNCVDVTWWYVLLDAHGALREIEEHEFADAEGVDCNYIDGPFRTFVGAPTKDEAIKIAQHRWRTNEHLPSNKWDLQ